MVNGDFVYLWKTNQIKEKYQYDYEDNLIIWSLSEKNTDDNLIKIGSNGFESNKKYSGAKILKEIELNGSVTKNNNPTQIK